MRANDVIEAFFVRGEPMRVIAMRFHIKKWIVEEILRAYSVGKATRSRS